MRALRMIYDGVEIAGMVTSAGGLADRLIRDDGGEIIAEYTNANPTYHYADERGSVVARTDPAGITSILRYDAYGVPATTNSGFFQYTGQMWLGAIGIYNYKNRNYHPKLGRFLQPDPIGYAGDGPNLYAYVGNDPVNFVDPLGLKEDPNEPIIIICCKKPGTSAWDEWAVFPIFRFPEQLTYAPQGQGGGGKAAPQKEQPKSRLSCLGSAIWENKTGLALDTAGWIANFALPEGSAAVAIAGSVIGVTGIGAAIADNKGPADAAAAGTLAYTGKMGAAAEGMLRGAGSALGHRIGFAALAASSAYDVAKTTVDYNRCMSGN